VTADLVRQVIDEELAAIETAMGEAQFDGVRSRFDQARQVFEEVALAEDYVDFLTYPAYELLP
jgi:malate synthase